MVDPQLTDKVVGPPSQDYAYALPPFTWLRGWGGGGVGVGDSFLSLAESSLQPSRD